MLNEVENVVQHPGESRRRWFTSTYFDLIVWYGTDSEISEFELCYGKPNDEKALCWSKAYGFKHLKVDDGEVEPLKHKMTPIYLADGLFDKSSVSRRFIQESMELEHAIRQCVIDKISNFTFQR